MATSTNSHGPGHERVRDGHGGIAAFPQNEDRDGKNRFYIAFYDLLCITEKGLLEPCWTSSWQDLEQLEEIRQAQEGGRMKATKTWVLIVLLLISAINVHAWPWPDTGQTKCYSDTADIATVEIACPAPGQPFYGQDAQYSGPPRSYAKLGPNGVALLDSATQENGWVMTRDNVTGLVWEMKTDDGGIHDKDNTYTWCDKDPATNGGNQGTCGGVTPTDTEAFIKALNGAHFGGFSDWRMPTVKELSSLVNSSIPWPGPAIDSAWFPNTRPSLYWSSTAHVGYYSSEPNVDYRDYAWPVIFEYGHIFGIETTTPERTARGKKSSSYYVRAVRAGQSEASDHLVDNGDGTVTDTDTGLMWQKATAGTYTWKQALAYAEGLLLAGHTDWRLPNRNELQSLVDYSQWYPAIDPLLVPYMVWSVYYYWTSTTYADLPTYGAWVVGFDDGDVDVDHKPVIYYVRAVRAGLSGIFGHLIISAPAQGDKWNIGEQRTITWDTAGIAGDVKISLSRQGGKTGTFETIIASTENDGAYNWTVTGPNSVNCVLKIEPVSDLSKGTSQGLFSITGTYRKVGLPWLLLLLGN